MREDDLDDLFARAQGQAMRPSEALMGRVMADAAEALPRAAPPMPRRVRPGFWAGLAAALGGAGAVAGLGSAAVAGVMIGFVQPETLNLLTGGYYTTAQEAVEMMPSVDTLLNDDALTGG